MRFFRGLPPFLRVVWVLGLLFPLTALAVLVVGFITYWSSIPLLTLTMNDSRVTPIGLNLTMLGLACSAVINTYIKRSRQPDREAFPLDSWQRQARAIALLAALPLCGLTLAAVIPPNQAAFVVVYPITVIGILVQIFANMRIVLRVIRLPIP